LEKRNVFSLELKTVTESIFRTVFGSEFQTAGAEHRNARFENVVVVDGLQRCGDLSQVMAVLPILDYFIY